MIRSDIPRVLRIESQNGHGSHPKQGKWCAQDFEDSLARPDLNRLCFVAVDGRRKVIGFCVARLKPDSIKILNLAVGRKWERHGVGTSLLDQLLAKMTPRRYTMECDVRDSCLDAQIYLRKRGFRAVKVLRNWFTYCGDDCYRFRFTME